MGAWRSTRHRLENVLPPGTRLRLVARKASPTPATGYYHVHVEQEQALVDRALADFAPARGEASSARVGVAAQAPDGATSSAPGRAVTREGGAS